MNTEQLYKFLIKENLKILFQRNLYVIRQRILRNQHLPHLKKKKRKEKTRKKERGRGSVAGYGIPGIRYNHITLPLTRDTVAWGLRTRDRRPTLSGHLEYRRSSLHLRCLWHSAVSN